MSIPLRCRQLPHGLGLPLPAYQTSEAAGMDLAAALPGTAPLNLLPGERQLIPTGLVLEIPAGFEGQVRPRSGLALKHGITVLNSPGTVDSDYRGEVSVLLVNHGPQVFVVERGMRIAQLVLAPVSRAVVVRAEALGETARGAGGYGSTGGAGKAS